MRVSLSFSVVVGLLLSAGSASRAGLVEVPPFVGDLTENWESYPSPPGEDPFMLPDPSTIMGGRATISAPFMSIFEPGVHGFGLGTSGAAQPSDGDQGLGISGSAITAELTFDQPILAFGGFWGAGTSSSLPDIGDPAVFTFEFFSEANVLIGSASFEYSRTPIGGGFGDGVLEWHGWESTEGIKRITFTEDSIALDGLQAILVPEPSSILLMMVVAAVIPKRTRMRLH